MLHNQLFKKEKKKKKYSLFRNYFDKYLLHEDYLKMVTYTNIDSTDIE